MSELNRDDLRVIWRQLAQRNDWSLVENEAVFLDQAATEFEQLNRATMVGERMRFAIWRAYSVLLYRGLLSRQERAAQELWLAFVRTALRDRWSQPEAEELAQEVVFRVLDKLQNVKSPQGFLGWAFRIFRTARRDHRAQMNAEYQQNTENDRTDEPVDPTDLATEVEQLLIDQQLQALLRAKLPNDVERATLLAIVVFGDHPRDVAQRLGLPPHRTRLAKSRALKRLRQDEGFLQTLRTLAGDPNL